MSEYRLDHIVLPKVSETADGFLKGQSIVTTAGVFEYINHDGSSRLELRHPDDVFDALSLKSLELIPITIDHNVSLVNKDNAHQYTVGTTGEVVNRLDDAVAVSINITHKDGVDAVKKGKRGLSLAYKVNLIKEDGVYEGKTYTHRQKNIEYNNLSIVAKGRAGVLARINTDSTVDGVLRQDHLVNTLINKDFYNMDEDLKESTTRVDSVVEDLNIKTDKKEAVDNIQIKLDKALGVIDGLKAKIQELEATRTDSLIADKATARIALLMKAGKVIKTDSLLASSEREIMEAVIKKINVDADLSNKSNDYVEARFDALIEDLGDTKNIENQLKHSVEKRADNAFNGNINKKTSDIIYEKAKSNMEKK